MNQIPNIEEEVVEQFRNKILDVETAVRLTYNEKDSDQMIEKMLYFIRDILPKSDADISHFVAMKSKFLEEENWVRYIVDSMAQTHHHQLQKAREEEREQKANELQEMLDGPYSQAIYSWRPDNYVSFIRKTHHSELDQDNLTN